LLFIDLKYFIVYVDLILYFFSGQVPAEAEANFLKKAASLDTYGVDPHRVKVSISIYQYRDLPTVHVVLKWYDF
jgi:hypothetical protein